MSPRFRPSLELCEARTVPTSFRYSVPEGTEFTPVLLGSLIVRDRTAADLRATVVWGDGTTTTEQVTDVQNPAGPFEFEVRATHLFHDEGPQDEASLKIEDTKTGKVYDVAHGGFVVQPAPQDGVGRVLTVPAGRASYLTVATTADLDPEGAEAAGNYRAVILWGDGTRSDGQLLQSGNTFNVSGTHTYRSAGKYQATVQFMEDDGGRWYGASVYLGHSQATSTVLAGEVRANGGLIRTVAALGSEAARLARMWINQKSEDARTGQVLVDLGNQFARTFVSALFPKPPARGANLTHHAWDFAHGVVETMLLDTAESAARAGMVVHNPLGTVLQAAQQFPAEYRMGQALADQPGAATKLLQGYVQEALRTAGSRPGYAMGRVLPAILDGVALVKGGTAPAAGIRQLYADVLRGARKPPVSDLSFPAHKPGSISRVVFDDAPSRPVTGLGTPVKGVPEEFDKTLEVANATPAQDRLAIEIRNEILNNPVGQAAARQVVDEAVSGRGSVKVVLDFAATPNKGVYGAWIPHRREIRIYVNEHTTAAEIGRTFAHETKHVRFGSAQNSLYEEFFTNVRDFLYQNGRRPTAAERVGIWDHVRQGYYARVTNGQMTVTIDDLLTRPYGLRAGYTGWPGLW